MNSTQPRKRGVGEGESATTPPERKEPEDRRRSIRSNEVQSSDRNQFQQRARRPPRDAESGGERSPRRDFEIRSPRGASGERAPRREDRTSSPFNEQRSAPSQAQQRDGPRSVQERRAPSQAQQRDGLRSVQERRAPRDEGSSDGFPRRVVERRSRDAEGSGVERVRREGIQGRSEGVSRVPRNGPSSGEGGKSKGKSNAPRYVRQQAHADDEEDDLDEEEGDISVEDEPTLSVRARSPRGAPVKQGQTAGSVRGPPKSGEQLKQERDSRMVDNLIRESKLEDALEQATRFTQAKTPLLLATYTRLFAAISRNQPGVFVSAVDKLMDLMVAADVTFDTFFMNVILNEFARKGILGQLLKYKKRFEALKVPLNTISYSLLIAAFGGKGDWARVSAFQEEMQQAGVPRDAEYCSIVLGIYKKAGKLDEVLQFAKEMKEGGLEFNASAYTQLLDVHGRKGDMKGVTAVLEEMRAKRIPFTEFTFAAIISAFAHCRRYKQAIATFEEMKKMSVKPDMVVYNTVLDACGHYGDLESLKKYWTEMVEEANIRPTESAFASKMEAFLRRKQLDNAVEAMNEMTRYSLSPTPRTFFTFLKYFLKSFPNHEMKEEAEKLLDPIRTKAVISSQDRFNIQKFIKSLAGTAPEPQEGQQPAEVKGEKEAKEAKEAEV